MGITKASSWFGQQSGWSSSLIQGSGQLRNQDSAHKEAKGEVVHEGTTEDREMVFKGTSGDVVHKETTVG